MADEFTWEEAMELDGECCEADDGQCSGPVDLRPGIRLTNVWFFLCEHHWEQRLAGANWDGVHEQQRHLDAVPLDPREGTA